MKIFVPDASVILKWVLGEDKKEHDKAIALLEGWLNQEHEFVLPSIWLYEVGNVIGLKRPKDAERILEILLEYEFTERPIIQEIVNITLSLMREFKGITFYDGVYHALAIHENGFMVTADSAYFERVKEKGRILLI